MLRHSVSDAVSRAESIRRQHPTSAAKQRVRRAINPSKLPRNATVSTVGGQQRVADRDPEKQTDRNEARERVPFHKNVTLARINQLQYLDGI